MLNNALRASVLAAALIATAPTLAHDTNNARANLAQAIHAAHYAMPHGKSPHGTVHAQPPRLGVALDALSQPQLDTMQLEYGVRITEVMPGSPAAKAGIQTGDVVTSIDGRPAYSPERMQHLVNRAASNPAIELVRDGQQLKLDAALGDPETSRYGERAALGIRIQEMTDDLKEAFGAAGGHGVLVSQVGQGSAAGDAGMKAGDVIVRIGAEDVGGVSDVRSIIGDRAPGDKVDVTILRDRNQLTLSLALGAVPAAKQAHAMHPHGMPGYAHPHKHGYHGGGKGMGCYKGKTLRPS